MNNLKKNNAVNNDNLRVYEGLGSITGKLLDKVVGEFNKSYAAHCLIYYERWDRGLSTE